MRAYTVDELDELRRVVRNRWLWGSYSGSRGINSISRSYKEVEMNAQVEELVRTHMIAGHTAEDLLASETP